MKPSGATVKIDTSSIASLLQSRKERNTQANIRHNAILKSRSTTLLHLSSPPKPSRSASNRSAKGTSGAAEHSKSSPSSPRPASHLGSPRGSSSTSTCTGTGTSSSSTGTGFGSSSSSPRRHSGSSKRSLKAALASDGM